MPTMTRSTGSEVVTLRGGLLAPVDALRLLWDFEERDLIVRLSDDGGLLVGPRNKLTPADRERIRTHRDALVELVKYCNNLVEEPV